MTRAQAGTIIGTLLICSFEKLIEVPFVAKKRSARRGRDWRIIVFLILSALIVLTMILAYLPTALNIPT